MIQIELIEIEEFKALGIKIELQNAPILIIKGDKGFLACGYFRVGVADYLGDAMAVITGVESFQDMLDSKVSMVSEKAKELGIEVGETGKEALMKLF